VSGGRRIFVVPGGRRRLAGLAVAVLACALTAGSAAASQLSLVGHFGGSGAGSWVFDYSGDPGENNAVTVAQNSGGLVMTDPAAQITASRPCSAATPNIGACVFQFDPLNVKESCCGLQLRLADGDDTATIADHATVYAGDGNDRITGGVGGDDLWGGNGNDSLSSVPGYGGDIFYGEAGDDSINSRLNPLADSVVCGGGVDTVVADALDRVGPDCENVQR
jgi:RTX calcium-binding nonapeptide repeat (4 copies)